MLLDRTNCQSNIVIGIAPIIDFVAGICELFLLGVILVSLNLVPRIWSKRQYGGSMAPLVVPIYYLIMFYAMALALVIGTSGLLGISYEFVEADFVKWVLFRSCTEGLAIFFLHNGIGLRALKHSIGGGVFWSLVSGGIPAIVYYMGDEDLMGFLITTILFLCLLLTFYLYAWLAPRRLLHRRPALTSFAFLNVVILIFYTLALSILIVNNLLSSCGVEIIMVLTYCLQPFLILYAIRQDSLFWQGKLMN